MSNSQSQPVVVWYDRVLNSTVCTLMLLILRHQEIQYFVKQGTDSSYRTT
jgi:hypothetical protein